MPNLVNRLIVREVAEELKNSEAFVVVSFGGLDVAQTEEVRGKLAERGVRFRMVRNTLTRRALSEVGIELEAESLLGNTAIAFGDTEATLGAAKILSGPEIKKTKKVRFKAALLEGEVLGAEAAAALADVPDRDTSRAMLLAAISGPARGLATVLGGVPRALVRVQAARAEKGE